MSVLAGFDQFFPILLASTPIRDQECFEVEIALAGNNRLFLGVTAFENRLKTVTFQQRNSAYLYLGGGDGYYVDGKINRGFKYAA